MIKTDHDIKKAAEGYINLQGDVYPHTCFAAGAKWMQQQIEQPVPQQTPTAPSDAIEFAEWIKKSGYLPAGKCWYKTFVPGLCPTSELYEIFKQRTTTT
jgi:hypothetical protein